MVLKEPSHLMWDDRLDEEDKKLVVILNASLDRLSGMRAVEINVSGHFARSKVAWKLASYQQALLHRLVALMDGAAVAWNNRCTLSAMLSARAFMETLAVMAELESRVARLLADEDLGGLDAVAQHGVFATRDDVMVKAYPKTAAVNVLTYVNKFNKRLEGFRDHYDRLSERCHPNSEGHNRMFSKLDRSNGSIEFHDERKPKHNGQMILTALMALPLIEEISKSSDQLIKSVADFQHRVAPVGGPVSINR